MQRHVRAIYLMPLPLVPTANPLDIGIPPGLLAIALACSRSRLIRIASRIGGMVTEISFPSLPGG
jgi:hypothetical protein